MRLVSALLLFITSLFSDETKRVCPTGTRNYDSDVLAEAAYSNMSGKGRVELQMCEASFNSQLIVNGQTNNDANNYLVFTKEPSCPQWGAQKDVNSTTGAINVQNGSYTRFVDLRINGNANYPQGTISFTSAANQVVFDRCYISSTGNTSATAMLWPGSQATNLTVKNCYLKMAGTAGSGWGIYQSGSFYNLLIDGFANGARDGTYKNVAIKGATTAFVNAQAASNYNASNTASAPGANSLTSVTNWGLAANGYDITTSSALYNVGTNLSASGVVTDINNKTWSRWSIGVNDPYVAPASASKIKCGIRWRTGLAPKTF